MANRKIPRNEVEVPGDYLGTFTRSHADGRSWPVDRFFLSRAHFLEALAYWNREGAGLWSYAEREA